MTSSYEFEQDFSWSLNPQIMNLWKRIFWDNFSNIVSIAEQPKERQQWGDLYIKFSDSRNIRAAELKTRRPESLHFFVEDGCLLIEKISNIERNLYSSSITHSKAFWWCYGLTDYNKENGELFIFKWWIFHRKELSDFMLKYGDKYTLKKAPNYNNTKTKLLYHTLNWLVPLRDIQHLQIQDL